MNISKCLLIFLSFYTSISFAALNQWSQPSLIGTGSNIDVAVSGNGNVAVCTFSNAGNVYTASSTNQGQSWTIYPSIEIGTAGTIALSNDGSSAYVAFISGNHVIVGYSQDYGASYLHLTLFDFLHPSSFPSIATTPDGTQAFIAFRENNTSKLFSLYSANNGLSWINQTEIGLGTTPKICTNSTADKIYVTWVDGSNIMTAFSSNQGINWTNVTTVATGSSSSIAVSTDGNQVNLTWSDVGGNNTYSAYSKDNGQTWIQTSVGPGAAPSIAASSNDAIVVNVRQNNNTHDLDSSVSFTKGAAWMSFPDSAPPPAGTQPIVSLTSDGSLGIRVWIQGSNVFSAFSNFAPPLTTSLNASGKQKKYHSAFQKDIVNELSWTAIPQAAAYRVYRDGMQNMIFQGAANTYNDHGRKQNATTTYYLTWLDMYNQESPPTTVNLP
ncbi:MAG: hypothetical protein HKM07_01545 [Chlamydiae bacterium]|nr:hypothetical protein [Chlamydiota bacterium]